MEYRAKLISLFFGILLTSSVIADVTSIKPLTLQEQPGFFRFSYDSVAMPHNTQQMGLIGINYFADFAPTIYGGIGAYGAAVGTHGGLFSLGAGVGYHREIARHWWADAGMFIGGGGGKSSLVGGGLMWRPSLGVVYAWPSLRLGMHYSYITFPSGQIHSQQLGIDIDVPTNFYYASPYEFGSLLPKLEDWHLPLGKYLGFQHNDFAILLQQYRQRSGTQNTDYQIQDGTMWLVGAELDHYFSENMFWWLKTSGAFSGVPNGYMDVVGGVGHRWALGSSGFALVQQLGAGVGGGGTVSTGGGLLINPQLGVEVPLLSSISLRLSSGYIWATKGDFRAVPVTAELLYHLDMATGNTIPTHSLMNCYHIQGWRIQLLNQTYLYAQRGANSHVTSLINLVAFQIDQMLTPTFFLSYQGASAYSGYHTGGYATGMIGPGIQSKEFFKQQLQLFSELLIGAGGGGGLALSGGAIIEPVVGLRYAFTPTLGLQASFSQVKALHDQLSAPTVNVGVTVRFDTLNQR